MLYTVRQINLRDECYRSGECKLVDQLYRSVKLYDSQTVFIRVGYDGAVKRLCDVVLPAGIVKVRDAVGDCPVPYLIIRNLCPVNRLK